MAVLVIFGGSALAVAFMVVFLVNLCRDGVRIKIREIVRVDTEPTTQQKAAREANAQAHPPGLHAGGRKKIAALHRDVQTGHCPEDMRDRRPA